MAKSPAKSPAELLVPGRALTLSGVPFKGCSGLYIFGLGRGQKSAEHTIDVRNQWQRWATAAGFTSFTGLNDW